MRTNLATTAARRLSGAFSQRTRTSTRTATPNFLTASSRTATTGRTAATTTTTTTGTLRTAVVRMEATRAAVCVEAGTLRYVNYLSNGGDTAEESLLKGWDDGVIDCEGDDGT